MFCGFLPRASDVRFQLLYTLMVSDSISAKSVGDAYLSLLS